MFIREEKSLNRYCKIDITYAYLSNYEGEIYIWLKTENSWYQQGLSV